MASEGPRPLSTPFPMVDATLIRILRQDIGWQVDGILQRETIKRHPSVMVQRVVLSGRTICRSIIIKIIPVAVCLPGPGCDPAVGRSDLHRALRGLGAPLPDLYWHGRLGSCQCYCEILEDLACRFGQVHTQEHAWSISELDAVSDALASFHAVGLRLGHRALAMRWPHLTQNPLSQITGGWISALPARPYYAPPDSEPGQMADLLVAVGARYEGWMERLAPLHTVLHGDLFWGNVALTRRKTDTWQAWLLDLESTTLGIPQYDIEYLTQRGWVTEVTWDKVREHHFAALAARCPQAGRDERAWRWGYRVALLQLMLWGHWRATKILEQGEAASPRDRNWVQRCVRLFTQELADACRAALDEDPR